MIIDYRKWTGHQGNPRLRRPDMDVPVTEEQAIEIARCIDDPVYFAKNYIKIVHVDHGLIPFAMWNFQEDMLNQFANERFNIVKTARQVGKCVHINTPIRLRNKKTGEIIETTVGEFYESQKKNKLLSIEQRENINRKFIDTINLDDWEIDTDSDWCPVTHIHKTIEYEEWIIETEDDCSLICADDHIVFDENYQEIFAKDCIPGITKIITRNGFSLVKKIIKTDKSSNMYDITVDSKDHRYWTGNILSHNTTVTVAYILWTILFKDYQRVAILANKGGTAREILARLRLAYENLPPWLQQGIITWNKGDIELENGSIVLAGSTTSSAVRGFSFTLVFLDEFAFVPTNLADDFFTSTYPTISSGKETKVIIVSTPNGMNHFYKRWTDAEEQLSEFKTFSVHWTSVPGRDEKWKAETIRNTSEMQFMQEMEAEFLGSSNTLISGIKLKELVWYKPIEFQQSTFGTNNKENGFSVYDFPKDNRQYAITVDVSRGQGNDYSAFAVIDVTEIPYKLVAKFRDNHIPPIVFPTIILIAARRYNNALTLVELNDVGQQIAETLHFELEYENLVKVEMKPKLGQIISQGFQKRTQFGLKTSPATKKIGCANLKALIENNKLIINDAETIMELTTFIAQKNTYMAEAGSHDDLAMCLVLFGWLINQRVFKENIGNNIRSKIQQDTLETYDESLIDTIIFNDGLDDSFIDDEKQQWFAERKEKYIWDDIPNPFQKL